MLELTTVSLLNGVVYGLLLFMLTSGLTLIFGMMGVLNFAHASVFMLGAYFSYQLGRWIGFWPALVIAPLLCGLIGAGIERYGLRHVHRSGHVAEILFTFGLAYLIEELVTMVWGRNAVANNVRQAIDLLTQARLLSEAPEFSDIDRADVVYRVGVCRYKLSSISTAIALFDEALRLADAARLPCDVLKSNILSWRSRCYRRQRDWEAAREDVSRALELAEGLSDRRTLAQVYFQASMLAEREGHWVLARNYAERAKAQLEEISDRAGVGRLLNNLGAFTFLLGRPEEAVEYLKEAFGVALEVGHDQDAAQAVSSLAQVHLRTGEPVKAEEQARHALKLLDGRVDFLDEIGNAQLVLGRALLDQKRFDESEAMLAEAESSFDQLSSASHRAAAWVAQGDLAERRGDDKRAATLYKRAAEILQDFRF